jgi:uncharacterized protein
MAYGFCLAQGIGEEDAAHIRDCIATHRFRKGNPPASIEAKVLFDADKLDAAGTMGIARTLISMGVCGEPLYQTGPQGQVLDGTADDAPSFFHEYNRKLKKVYGRFHTHRAAQIAEERREAATAFYRHMLGELGELYETGQRLLEEALSQ